MPPLMPAPTEQLWSLGPKLPRAGEGVVDVWRADLAAVADGLGELLDAEETARAARLLSERDRRLWMRSRGVLRALLGRYLGIDPRVLRFSPGEHGKPVVDAPGTQPLHFNLSHSGETALYAISAGRAVGIDVEVARRPIDEPGIAARVLGNAEAERLRALEGAARTREFLRAWVAHEAAVKCRGTGLAAGSGDPGVGEIWTEALEVGPRAAGAVAVEGARCELRLWEWAG
jgi:4'-phosphopantetheinyl transferase